MSKQASATKVERKQIILPVVRLSYPNLFTARAMKSDDGTDKPPEYSASFILDKKIHAAVIREIEAEVKKVAIEKWGAIPKKFRSCLRDGSTFTDKDDETKDGYGDGVMAINARSKAKQHTFRRDKSPADEDELYGGCFVNAVITLWTWEHPANGKGVSANLGPVQFVKNGPRFGAPLIDGNEVFEDLGEPDPGDDDDMVG